MAKMTACWGNETAVELQNQSQFYDEQIHLFEFHGQLGLDHDCDVDCDDDFVADGLAYDDSCDGMAVFGVDDDGNAAFQ